ncbi:nuclear transport factor 2 family protein [Micromonospora sp. NPDC005206]|uniref:nuclear transport factor 2 family protein n=1 Tax=Micromonospora sp. NPDC005206 TaxID=3157022 RepID=UPI0033A9D007
MPSVELKVVGQMYRALRDRDAAAIVALLHEDCVVRTAPGLPFAGGSTTHGPAEALELVWAEIDRHLSVWPDVERCIPDSAGTVVGVGVYRGEARATGQRFEAWFAHQWILDDGRIAGLRQITDTAQWIRAPGSAP